MVKTIAVNVTYNNNNKIISCQQHEFPQKVAEFFKINVSDVVMYAVNRGSRQKINPSDIKDVMKIEMVPRKGSPRNLRSCPENDTAKSYLESITKKLRQNSQLSGDERRALIEGLEIHSLSFFRKRKLDVRDDVRPETSFVNKKVQVAISTTNFKDSFAQTDPVNIPEMEQNSVDNVTEKLKRIAGNPAKNDEISSLMKASFPQRRNSILLNHPTVTFLKEMYPALFCLQEVKKELDRILCRGKCKEFIRNIEKYAQIILDCLSDNDEILAITNKSKQTAQKPVEKAYATMVGSIIGIANLADKQFGFVHLSDYPHGSADVYPYIDASCTSLKDIFFDRIIFHIYVEGQHLCEAPNFPEAVLCLIASFFIFNIHYPDSCRRTFTIFEKLFLNANDTKEMDEFTEQMIKLLQMKAQSE